MNNGSVEDLEKSVIEQYEELNEKHSKGLLMPSKYLEWWEKNSPS